MLGRKIVWVLECQTKMVGIYFQAVGERNWPLIVKGLTLSQWLSNCHWGMTRVSITWALAPSQIDSIRNPSSPHLNKPAGWFWCTLKFENHWFRQIKIIKARYIREIILLTVYRTETYEKGIKEKFQSHFQEEGQKEKNANVFKRFAIWHLTAFQDHLLPFCWSVS